VPEANVMVWPKATPPKKFLVETPFKSVSFTFIYSVVEFVVKDHTEVPPLVFINIPPPVVLSIKAFEVTPLYVTQFWFVGAAAAIPKHISAPAR